MNIALSSLYPQQKKFFETNVTKSLKFRLENLQKLEQAIEQNHENIIQALNQDMNKSPAEALLSEVDFVLNEIRFIKKNLKSWMNPQKIKTPMYLWPAKSFLLPEPRGVVLIISPWNYPFRLSLSPLVGAISAGNCATLKLSEHTPHTSALIQKILQGIFSKDHIAVVEGGSEAGQELLTSPFDHIFFTGSSRVGKLVMQAAAKNLTPVTLEMGGKNPAILHKDAHLKSAVPRLLWSKFFNSGQTCLAPNFVFVHKSISENFLTQAKAIIQEWFGPSPENNPSLTRMIHLQHWEKLKNYLQQENIYYGGKTSQEKLFIEPTLILNPSWDSTLIKEEIFGPILPVIEYSDFDGVLEKLKAKAHPLTAYLFSQDKNIQNKFIEQIRCGSVMINDALSHANNIHMPFGGVKESGTGCYYGKHSFGAFSHHKPITKKSVLFDFAVRYPPYSLRKLKILRYLSR